MHKIPPFVHVTAMRLAFEAAVRVANPRRPMTQRVRTVLGRRRNKPGVIFHRKGWYVVR